jgi:hypothetical protein
MVVPALSQSALPADHLKRVRVVKFVSRALGDTAAAAEQANYRVALLSMKSIANALMPE